MSALLCVVSIGLCWFVVLADVPALVPCLAHALLLPCRAGRRLTVVLEKLRLAQVVEVQNALVHAVNNLPHSKV